jgi:transposase
MPQPYSDDWRRKLLQAYEAGAGSRQKLAGRFRVSWGCQEDSGAATAKRREGTAGAAAARPGQSNHGHRAAEFAGALKTITTDNAVAWFPHCGYGIQQN